MTETTSKRRAWVKNAAIIFLAVLLVLTFFSNTFLNRSLPEVAAQYPTSGSINLKIRGTGVVSSNQVEHVTISESRKVKGVAIRAGDTVTQGQALFLLSDTESAELAGAKELLESMEMAYQKALLDRTLSPDNSSSYEAQSAQLNLQKAIERRDKAKLYDSRREPLQEAVDAAARALMNVNNTADSLPEKARLEKAQESLKKAQAAQEKAKTDLAYYSELYGVPEYGTLAETLERLNEEWDTLEKQRREKKDEYDELYDRLHWGSADAESALRDTITEVADSYLKAVNPAQQAGEIADQYQAAKETWDTLVSRYYDSCVAIERDNAERSFRGPVRLTTKTGLSGYRGDSDGVLVFVTSAEFGNSDLVAEILNATEENTEALTWAYRSMIWWHLASESVSGCRDAESEQSGLKSQLEQCETELHTLEDQQEAKDREISEKKKLLNNRELSNAYDAVLAANAAVKEANDAVYDAQLAYDEAAKAPGANVEAAQKAYDKAKENLAALEEEYRDVGSYADEQRNVLSAQQALEAIYRSQQSSDINAQKEQMDLDNDKKKLDEQAALVAELEKGASETIIYAPCSGTVTEVNVAAGDTTIMDQPMATIELTDQGHTLTFEVTKEQAAKVNPGEQAEVNDRWGVDIIATLVSITSSKQNPGANKVLTFDLKGSDVTAGQSLTLSVGQKSQSYEVIIPNSALRTDAAGSFVMIVNSKSTPLGNRYYADRVDVEVLASDDNNSAVKGMLSTGDFVIMTSNAPISAGDMVRLPEG